MAENLVCPQCGAVVETWRNPAPTVDLIIYTPERGIVLIRRGHEPLGFALPGGFVEIGETVEHAAIREAAEETNLHVRLKSLLGVWSDPQRDPRRHTISAVFLASADDPDRLASGDDAAEAKWYTLSSLPAPLAFDHAKIIARFQAYLHGECYAAAIQQ